MEDLNFPHKNTFWKAAMKPIHSENVPNRNKKHVEQIFISFIYNCRRLNITYRILDDDLHTQNN
jgi:hypothetical protein